MEDGLGSYSFTNLGVGSSKDNLVIECSICQCLSDINGGATTNCYGYIGMLSSNVTKNDILHGSGSAFLKSIQEGVVNYSTFEYNHAKESNCLNYEDSNFLQECCNIINNTQYSTENGAIRIINGDLTIRNCTIKDCFKNGTTFSTFFRQGGFNIINCNIDDFSSYNEPSFSTESITNTSSINLLHHLSTDACKADFAPKDLKDNNETGEISISYIYEFISLLSNLMHTAS